MSRLIKKIAKKKRFNGLWVGKPEIKNRNKKPIIAITGSIASGKDFIAKIFAKNGFVVFDADQEVRNIISNNLQVIEKIAQTFPNAVNSGKISRPELGDMVFKGNSAEVQQKTKALEQIIYPELQKFYEELLNKYRDQPIILNIPLFFEKANFTADIVISAIAPLKVRRKRFFLREILKNGNLSSPNQENISFRQNGKGQKMPLININSQNRRVLNAKFFAINATQINNLERKKLYKDGLIDYLINTNCSKNRVKTQILEIMNETMPKKQ
jgi:dephospho-CoA kinase